MKIRKYLEFVLCLNFEENQNILYIAKNHYQQKYSKLVLLSQFPITQKRQTQKSKLK